MTKHRPFISWIGLLALSCVQGTDVEAPNPVPFVDHVQPQQIPVATSAPVIDVHGADFVEGAVGSWNGSERTTEFVSATHLRIVLGAADVESASRGEISVANPAPGGGDSRALGVDVVNAAPQLDRLEPDSARAIVESVELHVVGSGFVQGGGGSRVVFRGVAIPTTVLSSDELVARPPAHLLRTGGTISVHVVNPAPGGGSSGSLDFRLSNPLPALDSLSPDSLRWADPAEVELVGGTFVQGSVVWVDGVAITPLATSERSILFRLPNGPPARDGRIRVEAPGPGGGLSNEIVIGIRERKPTITGTDPQAIEVGGGGQSLRVHGRDFARDAQITLNGAPRTTTFVDSTTLELETTAADADSLWARALRVVNPRGGGPSDPLALATVPVGRLAVAWRFESILFTAALNGADRERIPLSTVWLETWPTGRDLLIVRGVGFFDPEPGLFRLTPGVGQTRIVDGIVNAPRITDDASWIYFWRDADILRVRPDGTDEEVIASGSEDTVLRFPDPSPDGDRLLYARYRPQQPSNQRDLVILDLQTRTTTSLPVGASEARWSPDGAWIAYRTIENFRLVRSDGTDDQPMPGITFRAGNVGGAFDWSPDGKYLVVMYGNAFQLLELDTGKVLTIPGGDCQCPYGEYPNAWQLSWYRDP